MILGKDTGRGPLIDCVVLKPVAGVPAWIQAQLYGDLAALLALSDDQARKQKLPAKGRTGSQLSLVAGVGFEPTTFRL